MKQKVHIINFIIATCLLATISCNQQHKSALKATEVDSLIETATKEQDLERVIYLSDSLEKTGDMSIFRSCYMKGSVYTRTGRPQDAEATLKRALAEIPKNTNDSLYYFQCVKAMTEHTIQKNDFEGLLRFALPAYEGLNALVSKPEYTTEAYDIFAEILQYVGMAQVNIGMTNEASKSFDKCLECIQKVRVTRFLGRN